VHQRLQRLGPQRFNLLFQVRAAAPEFHEQQAHLVHVGKIACPQRRELGGRHRAGLCGCLVLFKGHRLAVLERQYVGAGLAVVALELHDAEAIGGQRGLERGEAAVLGGFPCRLEFFLAFPGFTRFGMQSGQFFYILDESVHVLLEGLGFARLEVQGTRRQRCPEAVDIGDVAEFQLLWGVG